MAVGCAENGFLDCLWPCSRKMVFQGCIGQIELALKKTGNIDQDFVGHVGCEKDDHHKSPICTIAQTTCGFVDLMTAA